MGGPAEVDEKLGLWTASEVHFGLWPMLARFLEGDFPYSP